MTEQEARESAARVLDAVLARIDTLSWRYYQLSAKMTEGVTHVVPTWVTILPDDGARIELGDQIHEVTLADLEFSESMPEDWFAAWWRNAHPHP